MYTNTCEILLKKKKDYLKKYRIKSSIQKDNKLKLQLYDQNYNYFQTKN